ncbi:transient receptor potential cation channel subfamily A member 1-like [Actinia tenebrosa]|uniref:Transient receptor potential cation channel subfamily A member 1-like n=1 Tax=Actinia tenebrosa TaxID=6105 RepID=A0A6P8I872_ACTTE|nr:transient receptor potential cation channel subfamily A member 1-like [Actinia tenebrosa]
MIRKTIKTVLKVLIILLIFLAAFAFAFHVITCSLTDNYSKTRFGNIPTSLAATFFMMLDNLRYEEIVLNYYSNGGDSSKGNGFVLYGLFIAYCFMMPIIFLNLLIGLAVGDIDSIRKTAAMERYTSQVEHLSQLERALPTFILSKAQIMEYVEHPNRPKNLKNKIVDFLVKLLSPRQEQEKKSEDQTNMDQRIARHEAQLKQISSTLKSQSALLEELRDILLDSKKTQLATKLNIETPSSAHTQKSTVSEFQV